MEIVCAAHIHLVLSFPHCSSPHSASHLSPLHSQCWHSPPPQDGDIHPYWPFLDFSSGLSIFFLPDFQSLWQPDSGPTSWPPCHAQLPSCYTRYPVQPLPQVLSHSLFSFSCSPYCFSHHCTVLVASFFMGYVQEEGNPGRAGGKECLLFALVPQSTG